MAKGEITLKNGNKQSKGREFTSETAREARMKRTIKERNEKSITEAVKKLISQEWEDKNGKKACGADIIAQTIFTQAQKGNTRMVEFLVALIGEKPVDRVEINNINPETVAEVEELIKNAKARHKQG